jgi:hypothetical protein
MNAASSEARKSAAWATSRGFDSRPMGIEATNFLRFSGVSGMPMKASSRPVSPITGFTTFTRIFSGPSSAAIEREVTIAAPFEPLYQVSPGRGRTPAVEAMFTKQPLPARRKCGTACLAVR